MKLKLFYPPHFQKNQNTNTKNTKHKNTNNENIHQLQTRKV